jgi:hypothetical protein
MYLINLQSAVFSSKSISKNSWNLTKLKGRSLWKETDIKPSLAINLAMKEKAGTMGNC